MKEAADARQILYQNFDRKVGNPKQWMIHNFAEMNNFILSNSGQNDECYASICSFQKNQTIFDDLFLEEDNKNIKAISTVGQWYSDNNIPWIPIYSANRSFHIHAQFKPEIIQPETLKRFSKQIIEETHTEGIFDSHVIGNQHQMARIPNTQRISGRWCIPLSYEDVLNQLPLSYFMELSKSPQFVNYNLENRPSITEFIKDVKAVEIIKPKLKTAASTQKFILKDFIRPCIYEKLCNLNPSNMIRNAATRDALLLGLTPLQVLEGYSELNWVDFDPSYSKERIDYIKDRISQGYTQHFGKESLGCEMKNSCIKCLLGAV